MIDFPAAPTNGQIYSASNNVVYQFQSTPAPGVWVAVPGTGTTPGGDFSARQTGGGTPTAMTRFTGMPVITGNSGSWYVPGTGRYSPPAGRYFIYATFTSNWAGGAVHHQIELRKNNVSVVDATDTAGAANWYSDPAVSGIFDANGTDYFEMWGCALGGGGTFTNITFLAYPISGLKGQQGDQGLQGIQGIQGTPGVAGGGGDIPVGGIIDYGGVTPPGGWLLCDGASYLRSSYPNLFTAIGTTWGAVDGTHFNVPDLGGRVTAGKEATVGGSRLTAAGSGIVGSTLGAFGGAQTYTLTLAQSPSHSHGITTGGHGHDVNPGYSTMLANAGTFFCNDGTGGSFLGYTSAWTSAAGNLGGSTDGRGSDAAHQNTQPTIIMNKIIKT